MSKVRKLQIKRKLAVASRAKRVRWTIGQYKPTSNLRARKLCGMLSTSLFSYLCSIRQHIPAVAHVTDVIYDFNTLFTNFCRRTDVTVSDQHILHYFFCSIRRTTYINNDYIKITYIFLSYFTCTIFFTAVKMITQFQQTIISCDRE